MPTELELELLRMAAEERDRNRRSEQQEELPDLDPNLFSPRPVGVIASTPTPQIVSASFAVNLSGPDADWVQEQIERGAYPEVSMGARVASEQPNANGNIFPASLLASMFMTREAQAQAELTGFADLIAEGSDIEFDGEDYTVEAVPMGRRYGMSPGGQVVSQRGADGRFRPVERGIQPMGPERARTAPVSSQPTYPTSGSTGTTKPPPSPPQRPVDRSRIPTAIERVAGKDFLDD